MNRNVTRPVREPSPPTRRLRRALAGFALLAACKGEQPTDTSPPTPVETPECVEDADCDTDPGLICEQSICIVGDRDNGFDEATPLRQNEEVEGVIEPAGDVDFYVYESLGPEWLRVHTTTSGDPLDSLDTVVQVFAANGGEHARADNFATGRVSTYDSVGFFYLPYAGTWYVTVEDVSTHYEGAFAEPRGGQDFTYALELRDFDNVTREDDSPLLPSGTVELPGGSTIVAYGVVLETPGDSDWIVVDPPFGGEPLEVWGVPTPGSDATPLVRLSDRSTGELAAEKSHIGTEGILSYFPTADVLYDLEMTDLAGGGSDDHWYVVYVRTYEPGAAHPVFGDIDWEPEVEPNDDIATASTPVQTTEVNPSGTDFEVQFFEGTIDDALDADHYAVDVVAGLELSVRCWESAWGSQVDLGVTVLDAAGADVTPAGQGVEPTSNGYYVVNAPLAPGAYTVRLAADDGFGGLSAYYRCVIYQTDFAVDAGSP